MSKSHKIYAVHIGGKPGIYDTWDECRAQVNGYPGAKFKSFNRLERDTAETYVKTGSVFGEYNPKTKPAATKTAVTSDYVKDSISVDAACSGNPGEMEYQAVHTGTGEKIFGSKVYPVGTNNLGEFLAVVDALRYLQKTGEPDTIIYTDSVSALAWSRNQRVNTTLYRDEKTAELWRDIDDALNWLSHNIVTNPIVKWETKQWGESKADFGRK